MSHHPGPVPDPAAVKAKRDRSEQTKKAKKQEEKKVLLPALPEEGIRPYLVPRQELLPWF
jgi:hypothetical protein